MSAAGAGLHMPVVVMFPGAKLEPPNPKARKHSGSGFKVWG